MAEAFTAGVKPGGLTDDTQIRILLCYLIKTAGPLTRDTLQGALLQEQLVNYFEFADALAEVQKQGLVTCTDEQYSITDKGASVASTLAHDLPRTVREIANRAYVLETGKIKMEGEAQELANNIEVRKAYLGCE